MEWSRHCAAVIPCHNEESAIEGVVERLKAFVSTIIVVDDGSTDLTAARAERAGAHVIRHSSNWGKGAAQRSGCQEVQARSIDWALLLDGDGQHSPEDTPSFFRCAEETDADVVIGNRLTEAEAIPWLRRQTNRWMSRRIARLTGLDVPDSQCGFRLVHLPSITGAWPDVSHFEIESALLLGMAKLNLRVASVPVRVIYGGNGSKINPVIDGWRWFKWWRRAVQAQQMHVSAPATQSASHNKSKRWPAEFPNARPVPSIPRS